MLPLFLSSFFGLFEDLWSTDALGKALAIFLGLLALAILFGAVCVVLAIIRSITNKIHWYRNRQQCTHCNSWTLDASDGRFKECPAGQPCCTECRHQHEMDNEAKVRCPADDTIMKKVTIDGVLIMDRCPSCGGIWLDKPEELNRIKQLSYDEGYEDGQSSGHSSGVATGIVIGSAIS